MGLFCKHIWKVVGKTVLPSAYQQLKDGGQVLKRAGSLTPEFFQTKVFVVVACSKCGKLETYTKSNYADGE